jgi:hypothetical protein
MKAAGLVSRAALAEKQGDPAGALALFRQAVDADPSNAQARAGAERLARQVADSLRRAARAEFETLVSSAQQEAGEGRSKKVAGIVALLRTLVSRNSELRDEGVRAEGDIAAGFLSRAA